VLRSEKPDHPQRGCVPYKSKPARRLPPGTGVLLREREGPLASIVCQGCPTGRAARRRDGDPVPERRELSGRCLLLRCQTAGDEEKPNLLRRRCASVPPRENNAARPRGRDECHRPAVFDVGCNSFKSSRTRSVDDSRIAKWTTRDMFVPTCATCHMSGINGVGVTHDPSERLSYYLANAITEKRCRPFTISFDLWHYDGRTSKHGASWVGRTSSNGTATTQWWQRRLS
jgi:hypothetical protein